jgi:hypothetical protein
MACHAQVHSHLPSRLSCPLQAGDQIFAPPPPGSQLATLDGALKGRILIAGGGNGTAAQHLYPIHHKTTQLPL